MIDRKPPKRRSSSGSAPSHRKPAHGVVVAITVIALTTLALSCANAGPGTDSPPRQADQTREPDALTLATASHLNHRMAQAFVILGLKYEVDLEYDSLLAFFEHGAAFEEVSPIKVGISALIHDEYDYANEMEEHILKQGESPRTFLLQLSRGIASTNGEETTSPTRSSKTK